MAEEKTIYELKLHETLEVKTNVGGKIEITRVPGGWIYAFDYPGYRQSPIIFVPFTVLEKEIKDIIKPIIKKSK